MGILQVSGGFLWVSQGFPMVSCGFLWVAHRFPAVIMFFSHRFAAVSF